MDSQNQAPINGVLINKPRKKKSTLPEPESFQSAGENMKRANEMRLASDQKGQKASKRGAKNNNASPSFPEGMATPTDSLADNSTPGNDYRALRRKYLLLEEESFGLGRELKAVEDEIKALEEEKDSLLDDLVVMEGLVDPSDLQPQGQRLQ
ncbi:uncharacterized protein LOC127250909 [Andrographis paniculata]|uniref:uncharacterized protein LOC127250909 n=1 Tax=Andrographis paniculata TaxID=175694 RepID=UPI0021E7C575|nr:uncharacterized protein LOC127250909 [Andrographis paniculata]XP_051130343.1 uncharacterized protein LOC127250909 [Andrographis paniculata]